MQAPIADVLIIGVRAARQGGASLSSPPSRDGGLPFALARTKVARISSKSSIFGDKRMLVPLANLNGSDRNSASKAGVQFPSFCLSRRAGEYGKLSDAIGLLSRLVKDGAKSVGLVDPK